VADDRRLVESERVEDVVDQDARAFANLAAAVAIGARQPMAGKVDREQSPTRDRREERRPRGGAERDAVEKHQWRTAAV
jgi:hypothetical protein